ncbi:progestin membrane receptor component 1 [Hyaloraphidium curvatum]|nr:progestin membrane receptor component 1 [Hyaloraphidium curvatum]
MAETDGATAASPSLLDQLLYSPVNWVLCLILAYLLYHTFLAPKRPPPRVYVRPEPLPKKEYTPKELAEFDGKEGKRILMAVSGNIYDVTLGRNFYGPEGPYGNFAGRDASRGLAKGSFDSDLVRDPFTTEGLDDLSDLTADEVEALREWEGHFHYKYHHAGWLVASEADKGKVPRETDGQKEASAKSD